MCGYSDKLAVVYHKSMPFNNTQQLQCIVYDIRQNDIISNNRYHCSVIYDSQLPISPYGKLEWLDFSNTGTLLSYDSFGILRGLCSSYDNQWLVLLYTDIYKKSKNDYYWPIGCIDDKLMVIQCKTSNKVPITSPIPTLQSLALQLPLLNMSDQNTQHEERYIRNNILYYNNYSNLTTTERIKQAGSLDKELLQCIYRCLNNPNNTREVRSIDLSSMLQLHKSLQIAIQLANKNNKSNVASRLGLLAESKFNGNNNIDIDDMNTVDKFSIDHFIQLEKQKEEAKLANKHRHSIEHNNSVTFNIDNNDGEATLGNNNNNKQKGRLRKMSEVGNSNNNNTDKIIRRNAPPSNNENINMNIIDTTVNNKSKQGTLFGKEMDSIKTPQPSIKSVSKVITPLNPFAKKV